jgi:hypothetical protein
VKHVTYVRHEYRSGGTVDSLAKVVAMADEPKNLFRIHMGLVLAEVLCIPAFIFEIYRALAGNLLSWAYVFEWPMLGIYAIYMWHKMIQEERGTAKPRKQKRSEPGVDPQLAAWNDYLSAVHQKDQPAAPEHHDA